MNLSKDAARHAQNETSNPKTVDIFAAAFKSHTRIPQTRDPVKQKRYTVPYVRKYSGVFKTSTQRTQETKKGSIRKAMHKVNNLEAMAVIMQDYLTVTQPIAPFLKLHERTKADQTF